MKRLKISISFKKQYRHAYEHLLRQENKSEYIAKLVERDMQNEQEQGNIGSWENIRNIVLEILQSQKYSIPTSRSSQLNNSDFTKEEIDLINQLF